MRESEAVIAIGEDDPALEQISVIVVRILKTGSHPESKQVRGVEVGVV